MKRQLLTLIGAGVLLVAGSAFGQATSLRANVPFDFIVSDTKLPAGSYEVRFDARDRSLSVRSVESGHITLLSLARNAATREPAKESKLVFHQYGNVRFLRQAWEAGNNGTIELPRTGREAEVATDYPGVAITLGGRR